MDLKIYTFNEWKQSDNYVLDTFFQKLKTETEQWFIEPSLKQLTYDYFEYDSNNISMIYVATLTFHEDEFMYKLDFIVDSETLQDQTIEKVDVEFSAYDRDQNQIGKIQKPFDATDLKSDMILQLISETK